MREVDRVMIEEMHIELVQMMENAGRNLADLSLRRFGARTVTILAGKGGNGGGGLAAARHLANRGADVSVTLAPAAQDLTPVPAQQLDILTRMGVALRVAPQPAELVIDALIGYSLSGDPRGPLASLIEWANTQDAPVLSLDTPSGLDVTTGKPGSPCISATATMTLALPKIGLMGGKQAGELYLADISVPPTVFRKVDVDAPPLFTESTLVRVV